MYACRQYKGEEYILEIDFLFKGINDLISLADWYIGGFIATLGAMSASFMVKNSKKTIQKCYNLLVILKSKSKQDLVLACISHSDIPKNKKTINTQLGKKLMCYTNGNIMCYGDGTPMSYS